MKKLKEHTADTIESGSVYLLQPSSMQECQVPSKKVAFTRKSKSCGMPTPTGNFAMTLHLDSISADEALEPYWNEHCQENQSIWWLPHQIESHAQASRSSNMLSNWSEGTSNFWKKTIVPILSTCATSFPISLRSATPFMESEVVKGTKKIRFYPKNPKHLLEMLRQSRRAYNLAASCFAETDVHRHLRDSEDLKKTPLRKLIREYVKSEVEERQAEFVSSSCDESVLAAFLTRDAIIRQRKNGFAAKFSFKSLKDVKQTFILQRLSQGFVDKQMLLTERLPKECISRTTTFSFERGQWFICAQILIVTKAQGEIQAQRIVALDPGVRTFQTAYSIDQCTSYGQSFYTDKVFPLLLRIDKLLGMRAKSKHAQWKLHFSKRIDKAMWRVKNLINDLHRRIAHDLTKSFDVILLPTFETQEMSKKSSRKLHTKTVRSMLGLAHYRFQLHLKWMCKKLGKTLVLVNEAYTSKTESWSGIIHSKLGGAKTISDQKILVDRDINGARGIMLRSLYGSLFPEQETPNVSLVSF